MSVTQIRDGDYRPDGQGGFAESEGAQEVLERVLFQLTARRGRFPLLPQVGSRLYLLLREKPSVRGSVGASYAAEALAGEEDLQVTGAEWNEAACHLEVTLLWQGESLRACVPL
ncbi:MAG TPA: hypothetical protein H9844_02200 [Candidatus Evtepia faecigallinarum]|nr:hypothetical protein [Candidatus Evtepia faecigallinarum]